MSIGTNSRHISVFQNHRDSFKMCTFYRDTHLFWYECVRRKYDIEICRELVLRKSKSVYHLSRYTNSHRKKRFIKRFVTAFTILFRTKMSTPGDKNSSFPIAELILKDAFKNMYYKDEVVLEDGVNKASTNLLGADARGTVLGKEADSQPDHHPPNVQQSTSSTTNPVCHSKKCNNIGSIWRKDVKRTDCRAQHPICEQCHENIRQKRNIINRRFRDNQRLIKEEKRKIELSTSSKVEQGGEKKPKLNHYEVVPDQVVPTSSLIQHKTKEEVTKMAPHFEIINQSKLANLIIEKDKYEVMMMAVPLLSQLVEVKSVVHHSVRSVSRDKNWAALGLVGKKEKHGDTTLGKFVCLE